MLSPIVVAVLLAFGMVGGVMGWRRGTRFVHRRSLIGPELPTGMTRRTFERRLRRRRKVGRAAMTASYCLIGVAFAAVLVSSVAR